MGRWRKLSSLPLFDSLNHWLVCAGHFQSVLLPTKCHSCIEETPQGVIKPSSTNDSTAGQRQLPVQYIVHADSHILGLHEPENCIQVEIVLRTHVVIGDLVLCSLIPDLIEVTPPAGNCPEAV